MSNSQVVIDFVKRRKNNLIKVFGNKCCICGFDKWQSALEFHHVNPEEKEFGLTVNTTTKSLEKQLTEARKCILVCANCHRGIHSNNVEVPTNWKDFYDEEVATQLLKDLEKKKYFCKVCGKEKSHTGVLCPECAAKAQRQVERPTREELKNLIRTMPLVQVGLMFNVSDNAIRKWCIAEGLPAKKSDINTYTDEEWKNI